MRAATSCLIDSYGPVPVHRPASVADIGQLVRDAASSGLAVYPVGGGTTLDFGLTPTRSGVAIDLRGLDAEIDYPARDMTITIQAGVAVSRLQEVLAVENQRLPIDVPKADRATLGGALAVNASGPRRYGFGTLRDYVIGITVVNGEGVETKAGGRVVKNVAGYDLGKLHIGALGTLGIISQVTLKVRPLPQERAAANVGCNEDSLAEILDIVRRSSTRPVCIDVLSRECARRVVAPDFDLKDAPWIVAVGFEGSGPAVTWQVEQLTRELPSEVHTLFGASADSIWTALVDNVQQTTDTLVLKANIHARDVAAFCSNAAKLPCVTAVHAHAGNGIASVLFGEGVTVETAANSQRQLLEWSGLHGNVVVRHCPAAWKASLLVWGKPRSEEWLMRKVKQALDPHNVFNPGRFVGGI